MRVVIAKPGSYQYVRNTCCDDATLRTYKGVVFTLCPVHGVNTLITPRRKATTVPSDK